MKELLCQLVLCKQQKRSVSLKHFGIDLVEFTVYSLLHLLRKRVLLTIARREELVDHSMGYVTLGSLHIGHLCLSIRNDAKELLHEIIKRILHQGTDPCRTEVIRPLDLVGMLNLHLCTDSAILHHLALVLVFSTDLRRDDNIFDILYLLLQAHDKRMFQSRFPSDSLTYDKYELMLGHHQRHLHHPLVVSVLGFLCARIHKA